MDFGNRVGKSIDPTWEGCLRLLLTRPVKTQLRARQVREQPVPDHEEEAPNVQVRARQVRDAPQALLRCGVGLLAEAPQDKRLKAEVD